VVGRIEVHREDYLALPTGAYEGSGRPPGLSERRDQHAQQQGQYASHHQQLDQCEAAGSEDRRFAIYDLSLIACHVSHLMRQQLDGHCPRSCWRIGGSSSAIRMSIRLA